MDQLAHPSRLRLASRCPRAEFGGLEMIVMSVDMARAVRGPSATSHRDFRTGGTPAPGGSDQVATIRSADCACLV